MIFDAVEYAGNGSASSRTITFPRMSGVTPDFIYVKTYDGGGVYGVYRTNDDTTSVWDSSSEAARTGNASEFSNLIDPVSGGFTMTTTSSEGNSGSLNYIAWAFYDDGNDDFVMGSYQANGSTGGTYDVTPVSWTPCAVLWFQKDSGTNGWIIDSFSSGTVQSWGATPATDSTALISGGFTVDEDSAMNSGTSYYRYIMFKAVSNKIGTKNWPGDGGSNSDVTVDASAVPEFAIVENQSVARSALYIVDLPGTSVLRRNLQMNGTGATTTGNIEDLKTGAIEVTATSRDCNWSGDTYNSLWLQTNPFTGGSTLQLLGLLGCGT